MRFHAAVGLVPEFEKRRLTLLHACVPVHCRDEIRAKLSYLRPHAELDICLITCNERSDRRVGEFGLRISVNPLGIDTEPARRRVEEYRVAEPG